MSSIDPGAAPHDRESGAATDATFDALYQAYGARVLNVIYRMTGNAQTAEDLAQDVWLKVYKRLDTFAGRSQVYTWLYRVAVNHTLSYLRKEKRTLQKNRPLDDLNEVIADPTVTDADSNHQRTLEVRARSRAVWTAIQTLGPKYRVPLVLHYYEELSYREVADAMELSVSAVEARIHRAKKQLVSALGNLVDEL